MRWHRWLIGTVIAIPSLVLLLAILGWDDGPAAPSLQDVSLQRLDDTGFGDAFLARHGSLHIQRCRMRVESDASGTTEHRTLGCRVSAAPGDIELWSHARWHSLEKRPFESTLESFDVFDVGDSFDIRVVHYAPPLGPHELYDPLLLTNAAGTEALVYFRYELNVERY